MRAEIPTSLDAKEIVQKGSNEVVVEETPGRMGHHEGKDGQTLNVAGTKQREVGNGTQALQGSIMQLQLSG